MGQPFTDTDKTFSQSLSAEEIVRGEFEFNLRFLTNVARYREKDGSKYRFALADGRGFSAEISSTFPPSVRSDFLTQYFEESDIRAGQRLTLSFFDSPSVLLSLEPSEARAPGKKIEAMSNERFLSPFPLNTILYGPPGTGKTYKTAELSVGICDGNYPSSRIEVMKRYTALRKEGRIRFVTFHQSYGYEDFVEGIRPESKDGQVSYRIRPGIFRDACDAARRSTLAKPGLTGTSLKDRKIYKMSLGVAGSVDGERAFQYCVERSCVLLGWGEDIDFSECKGSDEIAAKIKEVRVEMDRSDSQARYVNVFKEELQAGDIIIASQGNRAFRAIGEVTGGYEFLEEPAAGTYHQKRSVRWLAVFDGNRQVNEIYGRTFIQSALYRLDQDSVKYEVLDSLLQVDKSTGPSTFVLVIDEINRANISKVFGELITLLEPDKREGEVNALTVRLPYSGDDFSIPANLHVVGTMNTADRSIALLDTALRRRFDFEELQPDYAVLPELPVDGVNLRAMLMALNERIEYLYDRDHSIGHAYFMHVTNLAELDTVFRRRVIPLLQEYFYEDWTKVLTVLNDSSGSFVDAENVMPRGLSAEAEGYESKARYRVKPAPFALDAYTRIYE